MGSMVVIVIFMIRTHEALRMEIIISPAPLHVLGWDLPQSAVHFGPHTLGRDSTVPRTFSIVPFFGCGSYFAITEKHISLAHK